MVENLHLLIFWVLKNQHVFTYNQEKIRIDSPPSTYLQIKSELWVFKISNFVVQYFISTQVKVSLLIH